MLDTHRELRLPTRGLLFISSLFLFTMKAVSPFISRSLCFLSIVAVSSGEDVSCPTPPPFDVAKPLPSIYFVMKITTGEYFTELLAGAREQARSVGDSGVAIKVVSSEGYDAKQADLVLEAAQDDTTIGILTVDGSADTLCGAISSVISDTEVSIVSFDFEGDACSEKQVLTSQFDEDMARLVLDEAVALKGKNINVRCYTGTTQKYSLR